MAVRCYRTELKDLLVWAQGGQVAVTGREDNFPFTGGAAVGLKGRRGGQKPGLLKGVGGRGHNADRGTTALPSLLVLYPTMTTVFNRQ